MRSGVAEADRVKIEGRQTLHRRKMAKNAPIVVNGADDSYAAEDESMVRQVNLAAAYHDHISCTKSADLCKVSDGKEGRVNLPCETDHIYANCSESKNKAHNIIVATSPSNAKDLTSENKRFRDMCLVQLELIKQLQEENVKKDRQLMSLKQEVETLKVRLERRDRRMCLLRKRYTKSDEESTDNISEVGSAVSDFTSPAAVTPQPSERTNNNTTQVHLVTRYFGRRSKTIPLRALKRRYLGPPKTLPSKKSVEKSVSSTASVASSETHDFEVNVKNETTVNMTKASSLQCSTPENDVKKVRKKHSIRPKGITRKDDFLTTDKAYYMPDNHVSPNSTVSSEKIIDVPSWKLKPVTSFYQMEGTENINDPQFSRRHLKFETDERRRKRWDIQRLREQKINEKLKYRHCRGGGKDADGNPHRKPQSFFPNPSNIEYIEVTDQLPVLAFGHLIPLFQPSEFSLSWSVGETLTSSELTDSSCNRAKKSRLSIAGSKVT